MTTSRYSGRSIAAALAAIGTVTLAGPATAIPLIGLTTTNGLVTFDSATPGTGSAVTAISGLTGGERIVDIDLRPTTGVLYGLSDAGRVYSLTSFGAATLAGTLSTPLTGSLFSIDFNPVADLSGLASLRIVSSGGQNLAFNVGSGATTVQTPIQGNVSTVAYSNNDVDSATATALYYIDASANTLLVATSAFNSPTITTVGNLGFDVDGAGGFDIVGGSTAFAALSSAGGARNGLYTINLASGTAGYVGAFANGVTVQGLTAGTIAAPIPEPSTYALLLAGLAGVGYAARRRRTAVAG